MHSSTADLARIGLAVLFAAAVGGYVAGGLDIAWVQVLGACMAVVSITRMARGETREESEGVR